MHQAASLQGAKAPGRQEGEGATTRERILAAAAELLHEQGYGPTTMRQIAARVGIKAASLYNHFSGKQELLYRIAYDTMDDMLAGARAAVDGERAPAERLRAFVRAHTTYCIVERYRARVADELRDLSPDNYREVTAIRDEYEQILKAILDEMGISPAGGSILAKAIATMASQVSSWYREGGRLSPAEIAELYADFALHAALGAASASPAARETSVAGRKAAT